jgi:predicted AlkP superfamily pyrophosphatase or phosphodiesterase
VKPFLLGLALVLASVAAASASPVLMISIDGLRPADVIEAKARGLALPTLSGLLARGAWASDVVNVIPTVTYPNHTTLITGVWPAVHGVANNVVFDPLQRNLDGWYWYAQDIKVPTLWDAVHARGGEVASLGWPVSVGARSIDADIPEYWRARTAEDVKLLRALSTPGLLDEVSAAANTAPIEICETTPEADEAKARYAAAIYMLKRPMLFTLHLSSLDETQHLYGPDTREAHLALERIDADVKRVLKTARAVLPDLTVAIVSDHGFAPVHDEVNILKPFVDAGLITLGPSTHKPVSWEAAPSGGASAEVVLARPDDEALKGRVKALLARLAADPAYHIDRVIDHAEIVRRGIAPEASFYIDFQLGYEMGPSADAPQGVKSLMRGAHGWFNDHPEMHASFFIEGPGVRRTGPLGQVDMRDIAPTLAAILGVELASAQGKPLF